MYSLRQLFYPMRTNCAFRKTGFTLAKLMLVVSITGLTVLILLPNLLRTRTAANENEAILSLQTIDAALKSYRATHNPPAYPIQLADLSNETPVPLDKSLTSGTREGYQFVYKKLDDNQFTVTAEPLSPGVTGTRSFMVDEAGEVQTVNTTNSGGSAGSPVITGVLGALTHRRDAPSHPLPGKHDSTEDPQHPPWLDVEKTEMVELLKQGQHQFMALADRTNAFKKELLAFIEKNYPVEKNLREANELTAIHALRSLSTVLESYRSTQSPPAYPVGLSSLSAATPPYIDSKWTSGQKQGYRFSYTRISSSQYALTAIPVASDMAGRRSFFVDETGEIRVGTDHTGRPIQ